MKALPKEVLKQAFDAAVLAADPAEILVDYLPKDRTGKVTVIGAGKGAARMAAAFERAWEGEVTGLVITRYGHFEPCKHIEVIEASHPVPDEAGLKGAQRILDLVKDLGENDQVIALISGGGSALLSLPAPGLLMEDKQAVNKALLKSGASINEINSVRKHLSAIKGGRLAKACAPASLLTLAISDVPGDQAAVIASGPTVADPSTRQQALEIIERYKIYLPPSMRQWLENQACETVKPDDECFVNQQYSLIATPQKSLEAAAHYLSENNINNLILSDRIEGESREIAKMHAAIARQCQTYGQPIKPPCVILSGGETTVTLRGESGCGGPNAEFVLSFMQDTAGLLGVYLLSADTDGIDGTEDNAGAWLDPSSYERAMDRGLNLSDYLESNRSYDFFKSLEDLFVPGPTKTNVNDFRAILVLPL